MWGFASFMHRWIQRSNNVSFHFFSISLSLSLSPPNKYVYLPFFTQYVDFTVSPIAVNLFPWGRGKWNLTVPNSHSPSLTHSARKASLCHSVHISVPETTKIGTVYPWNNHYCYETRYQDWLARVKCVKLGQGMEIGISFRIKWGKDGSQRKGHKSRKNNLYYSKSH